RSPGGAAPPDKQHQEPLFHRPAGFEERRNIRSRATFPSRSMGQLSTVEAQEFWLCGFKIFWSFQPAPLTPAVLLDSGPSSQAQYVVGKNLFTTFLLQKRSKAYPYLVPVAECDTTS